MLIKFYWLRDQNELLKKPSTSELIDWISALLRSGMSTQKIEEHIPFVGALLKKGRSCSLTARRALDSPLQRRLRRRREDAAEAACTYGPVEGRGQNAQSSKRRMSMAKAKALSLRKFTSSVQAAVKAAASKHPKFSIAPPVGITTTYLIRGIPVSEAIMNKVTLAEAQAYANDIASRISVAQPAALVAKAGTKGAVISVGGHVIIGIPWGPEAVNLLE